MKKFRNPTDDIAASYEREYKELTDRHRKELRTLQMKYAKQNSVHNVEAGDIINCGFHLFQVDKIGVVNVLGNLPQLRYYGPAVVRSTHKPLKRGAYTADCTDNQILSVTKPKK